ncbi:MAG TPA: cupin domain-containing protein [Chitinophaga sp.]|uniref:cupin domain-containing protein n=1 Tax=Chitinophaga sp. TaxID=1869181 RepID=UPI002BABB573|nr:cupin domain-containing protein [Chitinophaga sp.]HVI46213.1 cupin domain-containing protein [Chitinophaga sp.]
MNNNMNILCKIIAFAGFIILTDSHLASAQNKGIKRTDLQQHDLNIPGKMVIQAQVEIAPHIVSVRHRHPGAEIIYVLAGVLEYNVEGNPPRTLKAGEVLFIPSGKIHSVTNHGNVKAVELATYFIDKGKPFAEIVK